MAPVRPDNTGPRLDQTRIPMHTLIEQPVHFCVCAAKRPNAATVQRSETGFGGDHMPKIRRRRKDIVNNANRRTDNYIAPRAPWCYRK